LIEEEEKKKMTIVGGGREVGEVVEECKQRRFTVNIQFQT
jgi:hypothetical protein